MTDPGLSRRTVLAGGALAMVAAAPLAASGAAPAPALVEVASAERSWVQVAAAPGKRLFVNFSRWFGTPPIAVAEVMPDGALRPYPDAAFNSGDPARPPDGTAVSVQGMRVAPDGRSLWIVDAGNPRLSGLVPGGAKLVQIDLATDTITRTLPFDAAAAPPGSYLNDAVFDAVRGIAYLTDLARGAIVVLDLESGRARRVLDGHPSTQAEDLVLSFDGKPWLYPDGSRPKTASTSLALSPDGRTLYHKALVGRTLYAVPTASLLDPTADLGPRTEPVLVAHPSDAIAFGPDGALYLTAIDRNAITRWRPGARDVETVDPGRTPRLARGPELRVRRRRLHDRRPHPRRRASERSLPPLPLPPELTRPREALEPRSRP